MSGLCQTVPAVPCRVCDVYKTTFRMGKCVAKYCNSRTGIDTKAGGVTFHSVPTDTIRRKKWIEAIRLLRKETDWLPTKSTRICSKHFLDEDKINQKGENGRVNLSPEAIPMLVENSYSEIKEENEDVGETTNLDVETDEEIEEYIESQEKNKMRKTIQRLKLVCANRMKKIKNILGKNRRLEKQNKKLKTLLEELTKQRAFSKKRTTPLNFNDKTTELLEEFIIIKQKKMQ